MLSELALRQEEYRALVQQLRTEPDVSYTDAVAVAGDLSEEEQLVAISTVMHELKHRDPDEVNPAVVEDIFWANEFIDHMDTLGWHLVRKDS